MGAMMERVGATIERLVAGQRPVVVCLRCSRRYVLDVGQDTAGYRCGAAGERGMCRGILVPTRGNGGE